MSKASFETTKEWKEVNWRKLERQLFKLQKRIYKASERGDTRAVRRLQKTLVRSWKANDGDWVYWSSRMGNNPLVSPTTAKLLKKQKGKCPYCNLFFKPTDLIEKDHIIPKSLGGKDAFSNYQLLHKHCHDTKTAKDGSIGCVHDKNCPVEEPDEVKVSRPVLKTSRRGDPSA